MGKIALTGTPRVLRCPHRLPRGMLDGKVPPESSPPLSFHLYLYVYLYLAAVDSAFFAPFFSFGPQTHVAFYVIYHVQFLKQDVVDGTDNTAKLRRAAWAPVAIGCPFLTVHAITGCDHIPT